MGPSWLARKLRQSWRRFSLRDIEETIPPGYPATATTETPHRPTLFDPQDPAFVADPYPLFEYLRENEPIQRGATGAWVLSRYDDIAGALLDERLGNAPSEYATVNPRNSGRYLCASVAGNILPFLDPPGHTAPRKLFTQSFHQFIGKHPPVYEAVAAKLLASLSSKAEFELMRDFATPYSAGVFCRLLGLDQSGIAALLRWSDWFFYLLTVIPSRHARVEIDHALEQLRGVFGAVIDARKENPGEDYVSFLLSANDERERIGEEQLIDNLILLFADAVGNVDKAICAAVALLLRHPDQLALLQRRPELLTGTVDECLRFESPAQFISRVARQDLVIDGQHIHRNDAVILLLGSANRDPARFRNPDCFDISRFPNPHLAFGRSRHACIGGPLVRAEMQVAIATIFKMLPRIGLCSPDLNWQSRMGHRWLAELMLRNRDE